MPEITELIIDEHEQFRRRFAELDDLRASQATTNELSPVWETLADLLERHASAEEQLFYPRLMRRGENAEEETEDAVSDHNEIRDAVRRAQQEETGTEGWWSAVLDARDSNSDHMAEEEREALPDFREHVDQQTRHESGAQWLMFVKAHAGARGLDLDDVDVDSYLKAHG